MEGSSLQHHINKGTFLHFQSLLDLAESIVQRPSNMCSPHQAPLTESQMLQGPEMHTCTG